MPLFKLKVGSHIQGSGDAMKTYDARDPTRNVVDTEQDLAAIFPEKFEKYEGPPVAARDQMRVSGEVNAPPAPDEAALAEADMLRVLSQGLAPQRIQRMREVLDLLEERSQGTAKTTQQAAEAQEQGREDPRSHGELLGEAESHQRSQEAKPPEPPERSRSPVPQDQPSLSPEKEQELARAVQKESSEGRQDAPEQRRVMQGTQPAPQPKTPEGASDPAQRARETQQQAVQQQGQKPPGQQQQAAPAPQPPQPPKAKQKFQSLPPAQQQQADARLNTMTAEQLKALAEEEEVEVPRNAKKDDIILAIRQARR
jgi:hypothetical protein